MITARDALRAQVVRAYTRHWTTPGGIDKPKTRKLREREWAVARAVVGFAFDHTNRYGCLAPAGLWSELVDEAVSQGELIRTDRGDIHGPGDREVVR